MTDSRSRFTDQVQAVRQRPGMYLEDYSRQDTSCLVRALLRLLLGGKVVVLSAVTLKLLEASRLELEAQCHWKLPVDVQHSLLDTADPASQILKLWSTTPHGSDKPDVFERERQLFGMYDLTVPVYFARSATLELSLARFRREWRYERGYVVTQASAAKTSADGEGLRLEMEFDPELFDPPELHYAQLATSVAEAIKTGQERFRIEYDEPERRVLLWREQLPR